MCYLHPRLRLLFLARYSVLTAAFLLAVVPVSKYVDPELLNNLFVLDRPWQLFNVTWLSLLATALALVTFRVTQINAPARFGDYANSGPPPIQRGGWRWRWVILLSVGLAIPLACLISTTLDPPPHWYTPTRSQGIVLPGVLVLGLGIAAGLSILALLTALEQLLLHPDAASPQLLPFESFAPFQRLKSLRLSCKLYVFGNWIAGIAGHLGPGYVQTVEDRVASPPRTYRLLSPGHASLSLWFGVILSVYLYSYLDIFVGRNIPTEDGKYPALFFLLLLTLLVGTVLPGLSFFLDYYRLPVSGLLASISFMTYLFADTDHYYELNPPRKLALVVGPEQVPDLDLVKVFDGWNFQPGSDGKRTMVVVTAAGGGIQAATWTTRVLTGLDEIFGPGFTRSIGIISGVSGGSVGTMYYIAAGQWETSATVFDARARRQAIENSSRSSLEAIGWGIAYPDLMRPFVPFLVPANLDRGWAIEHAWQSHLGLQHHDLRVRDWVTPIREHKMPVVVFNATLAETGQRLLISPVLGSSEPSDASEACEFFHLYPPQEANPRVTTAVRLSSTFPYVSPISRPYRGRGALPKDYHVADGAYTDNEGVFTAMDWIDRLVDHYDLPENRPQRPFDRILLVRIQPFPIPDQAEPARAGKGWTYEVLGPIETIQSVRTASQAERNNFGLRILANTVHGDMKLRRDYNQTAIRAARPPLEKEQIKTAGATQAAGASQGADRQVTSMLASTQRVTESHSVTDEDIEIVWTAFTFHHESNYIPPLSWRMSPKQKAHIESAWQAIRAQKTDPRKKAPIPNQLNEEPLATVGRFFESRASRR